MHDGVLAVAVAAAASAAAAAAAKDVSQDGIVLVTNHSGSYFLFPASRSKPHNATGQPKGEALVMMMSAADADGAVAELNRK